MGVYRDISMVRSCLLFFLLSVLDYCSPVWMSAYTSHFNLLDKEKVFCNALRLSCSLKSYDLTIFAIDAMLLHCIYFKRLVMILVTLLAYLSHYFEYFIRIPVRHLQLILSRFSCLLFCTLEHLFRQLFVVETPLLRSVLLVILI